MNEFIEFFTSIVDDFPMHLEIYYSKRMDWCVEVWKKGCADEYPNSPRMDGDAVLVKVQDATAEEAGAMALKRLKEWLKWFAPWVKIGGEGDA